MIRTAVLTLIAMLAFAANSLLCRLALGQELIDAASFTSVRMIAGAIMLAVLTIPQWRKSPLTFNWAAVAALSCYMVFFSFAYLSLSAGSGALLLFGAVQLTMFAVAYRAGERFSFLSIAGLLIAFAGLVWLVAPGVTAPDPFGSALMVIAGIGWGAYSLLGRGSANALLATAANFLYSVPVAIVIGAIFLRGMEISGYGAMIAVASGALASGVGYAIWYAALRDLSAGSAATVQLSVPVIAAIGGVIILAEEFTQRLVIASVLTLSGIWLVLARRTPE